MSIIPEISSLLSSPTVLETDKKEVTLKLFWS